MPDGYVTATRRPVPLAEPFATAEEAVLWMMQALAARNDGAKSAGSGQRRPCEPDDVLNVMNRLYYRRRILLEHARVIRRWGERGYPPDPNALEEMADYRVWKEAMDRMTWPLQQKGIVAATTCLTNRRRLL